MKRILDTQLNTQERSTTHSWGYTRAHGEISPTLRTGRISGFVVEAAVIAVPSFPSPLLDGAYWASMLPSQRVIGSCPASQY